MRDAESLLDQLSLIDGEVTDEIVFWQVGKVRDEVVAEAIATALSGNEEATIQAFRALSDRVDVHSILESILKVLSALQLAQGCAEQPIRIVSESAWPLIRQVSATVRREEIQQWREQTLQAIGLAKGSLQPSVYLEALGLQIAAGRDGASIGELSPDVVMNQLLSQCDQHLQSALKECQIGCITTAMVTLVVPKDVAYAVAVANDNLRQKLSGVLGRPIQIGFQLDTGV